MELCCWYNQRCQPPWSQKELRHKFSEAQKAKHREPRGHLLKAWYVPYIQGMIRVASTDR